MQGNERWRPLTGVNNPSARLRAARSMPQWLQARGSALPPPPPPPAPLPAPELHQADPDYEVIEFPGQAYSNTPMHHGSGGRRCDLCGCSAPAVQCGQCNSQYFCASCDDMYHRHPKRQAHQRKRLEGGSRDQSSSVRPPLPPKGEPVVAPVPPPRRKMRRPTAPGSPQVLAKKEDGIVSSIKRMITGRPLPPPPIPRERFGSFSHSPMGFPDQQVVARGDLAFQEWDMDRIHRSGSMSALNLQPAFNPLMQAHSMAQLNCPSCHHHGLIWDWNQGGMWGGGGGWGGSGMVAPYRGEESGTTPRRRPSLRGRRSYRGDEVSSSDEDEVLDRRTDEEDEEDDLDDSRRRKRKHSISGRRRDQEETMSNRGGRRREFDDGRGMDTVSNRGGRRRDAEETMSNRGGRRRDFDETHSTRGSVETSSNRGGRRRDFEETLSTRGSLEGRRRDFEETMSNRGGKRRDLEDGGRRRDLEETMSNRGGRRRGSEDNTRRRDMEETLSNRGGRRREFEDGVRRRDMDDGLRRRDVEDGMRRREMEETLSNRGGKRTEGRPQRYEDESPKRNSQAIRNTDSLQHNKGSRRNERFSDTGRRRRSPIDFRRKTGSSEESGEEFSSHSPPTVVSPEEKMNGHRSAEEEEEDERQKKSEETPAEEEEEPLGPIPTGEWECKHCTFVNQPGTRVCMVCCKTTPNPKVLQQQQEVVQQTQPPPRKKSPPPYSEVRKVSDGLRKMTVASPQEKKKDPAQMKTIDKNKTVISKGTSPPPQSISTQTYDVVGKKLKSSSSLENDWNGPPRSFSRQSLLSDSQSLPVSPPRGRSPDNESGGGSQIDGRMSAETASTARNQIKRAGSQPPDYMANLVQKQVKQGLEMVKLLREAEERGFSAEDLGVSLSHCGEREPIAWLEDNWRHMIDTVVTLATNYGHERKENTIGTISVGEAREALRTHNGNVWAAVTECVEQRQAKYGELLSRGNFTREDVVTALTANHGDLEAAYVELSKSQLKPFLMRIWGPPQGADNEGAPPSHLVEDGGAGRGGYQSDEVSVDAKSDSTNNARVRSWLERSSTPESLAAKRVVDGFTSPEAAPSKKTSEAGEGPPTRRPLDGFQAITRRERLLARRNRRHSDVQRFLTSYYFANDHSLQLERRASMLDLSAFKLDRVSSCDDFKSFNPERGISTSQSVDFVPRFPTKSASTRDVSLTTGTSSQSTVESLDRTRIEKPKDEKAEAVPSPPPTTREETKVHSPPGDILPKVDEPVVIPPSGAKELPEEKETETKRDEEKSESESESSEEESSKEDTNEEKVAEIQKMPSVSSSSSSSSSSESSSSSSSSENDQVEERTQQIAASSTSESESSSESYESIGSEEANRRSQSGVKHIPHVERAAESSEEGSSSDMAVTQSLKKDIFDARRKKRMKNTKPISVPDQERSQEKADKNRKNDMNVKPQRKKEGPNVKQVSEDHRKKEQNIVKTSPIKDAAKPSNKASKNGHDKTVIKKQLKNTTDNKANDDSKKAHEVKAQKKSSPPLSPRSKSKEVKVCGEFKREKSSNAERENVKVDRPAFKLQAKEILKEKKGGKSKDTNVPVEPLSEKEGKEKKRDAHNEKFQNKKQTESSKSVKPEVAKQAKLVSSKNNVQSEKNKEEKIVAKKVINTTQKGRIVRINVPAKKKTVWAVEEAPKIDETPVDKPAKPTTSTSTKSSKLPVKSVKKQQPITVVVPPVNKAPQEDDKESSSESSSSEEEDEEEEEERVGESNDKDDKEQVTVGVTENVSGEDGSGEKEESEEKEQEKSEESEEEEEEEDSKKSRTQTPQTAIYVPKSKSKARFKKTGRLSPFYDESEGNSDKDVSPIPTDSERDLSSLSENVIKETLESVEEETFYETKEAFSPVSEIERNLTHRSELETIEEFDEKSTSYSMNEDNSSSNIQPVAQDANLPIEDNNKKEEPKEEEVDNDFKGTTEGGSTPIEETSKEDNEMGVESSVVSEQNAAITEKERIDENEEEEIENNDLPAGIDTNVSETLNNKLEQIGTDDSAKLVSLPNQTSEEHISTVTTIQYHDSASTISQTVVMNLEEDDNFDFVDYSDRKLENHTEDLEIQIAPQMSVLKVDVQDTPQTPIIGKEDDKVLNNATLPSNGQNSGEGIASVSDCDKLTILEENTATEQARNVAKDTPQVSPSEVQTTLQEHRVDAATSKGGEDLRRVSAVSREETLSKAEKSNYMVQIKTQESNNASQVNGNIVIVPVSHSKSDLKQPESENKLNGAPQPIDVQPKVVREPEVSQSVSRPDECANGHSEPSPLVNAVQEPSAIPKETDHVHIDLAQNESTDNNEKKISPEKPEIIEVKNGLMETRKLIQSEENEKLESNSDITNGAPSVTESESLKTVIVEDLKENTEKTHSIGSKIGENENGDQITTKTETEYTFISLKNGTMAPPQTESFVAPPKERASPNEPMESTEGNRDLENKPGNMGFIETPTGVKKYQEESNKNGAKQETKVVSGSNEIATPGEVPEKSNKDNTGIVEPNVMKTIEVKHTMDVKAIHEVQIGSIRLENVKPNINSQSEPKIDEEANKQNAEVGLKKGETKKAETVTDKPKSAIPRRSDRSKLKTTPPGKKIKVGILSQVEKFKEPEKTKLPTSTKENQKPKFGSSTRFGKLMPENLAKFEQNKPEATPEVLKSKSPRVVSSQQKNQTKEEQNSETTVKNVQDERKEEKGEPKEEDKTKVEKIEEVAHNVEDSVQKENDEERGTAEVKGKEEVLEIKENSLKRTDSASTGGEYEEPTDEPGMFVGEKVESDLLSERKAELLELLKESMARDVVIDRLVNSLFTGALQPEARSESRERMTSSASSTADWESAPEEPAEDIEFKLSPPLIFTDQLKTNSLPRDEFNFEREVRRCLAEGLVETYDQAEVAVRLMQLSIDREECLMAAKECTTVNAALAYLQQDCNLCAGKWPMNQMVSMLECEHRCCKECAVGYFGIQVRERTVDDCVCPFCHEPEVRSMDPDAALNYFSNLDIILKGILPEKLHELFQRKLRDRTLMQDPNFKWCNKCSSGFIADPTQKRLICPDCKTVTCATCRRPWDRKHEGVSCEEYAKWLAHENDPDTQVDRHLAEHGVTCPKCKAKYCLAKGGCMHLTCPHCKHEFCSGCAKPFLMGDKCKVSEFCVKLGLHSHHPRNCLFYLRDKEPATLEKLLKDNNVEFKIENDENPTGKCRVQLLKETNEGMVDAFCGHTIESAGLCRTHYIEELVKLIRHSSIDPASAMDLVEATQELRRRGKEPPARESDMTDRHYLQLCIKMVQEQIPLE